MGNEMERPLSCRGTEPSGVLVVDKPAGMTSFDAVARVRRGLSLRKAGHCGTLDPFATGVLLVCVNQATRISDQLQIQDKVYRFVMHLGIITDTLDNTGEILERYDGEACSADTLRETLERFRGKVLQKVPRFAAVKWNGNRLYKLARNGISVDIPPREVQIARLKLVSYEWPKAVLEVQCSKGTYIRQLGADIGAAVGCGAHVSELRRTASGPFHIDQATPLHEILALPELDPEFPRLIGMNEVLNRLPEVRIGDPAMVQAVYEGHLDPDWQAEQKRRLPVTAGPVRLVNDRNCLVAMWWPWAEGREKRKLRVFKQECC